MAAPEEAPSSFSPPLLSAETSPPLLVALPPLLPPLLPPSVPAIIPLPGGSATDPPSLLTTPPPSLSSPPSPSGADSESPVSSPPSPEQPSSPAPVAPPVDPPPVPAVSPPAPADPPPLPPEVPPPVLADPPPVLPAVPPTTPASPSLPPPETPTPENPSSPPPATPTPESPLSPPETPSTPENPSSPPPVTPSTPENPSSRPPATPSTPEGPSLPPPAAPSTPEGPSLPPPATPSTPKGHSFPPPATPSTPESPSFPPPGTPTPENPSFSPPATPTPKNPSFPPSTTPSPTPATPLSPPATSSTPANPSSSPRSTPSTPANPSSSPPTTPSPNPESPSLSPPSTPSSPTNPSSSPPTTPSPNPETPSSSPRTTPSRTPANPSFTPPATPSSPTPTDPSSSPPATPSSPTPANPSPETPANPSSPTTPASPSSSSPANPSSPTPANPSSATPTNPSSSPPSTPSPSSELPLPLTSPPSPNLPATPSSVPLFYPSSPSDPNSPKNPIINSAASLSSSTHAPTIRSANKSGTAAGIAIITTLVVLGVIGVLVWSIRKWKRKSAFSTGYFRQSPFNSSRISEASYPGSTKKSQIYAFQRLESDGSKHSTLQFSYQELSIATNGFSAENLLGEGGFGSVFRGRLSNGKSVAVKQLRIESGRAEREFQGEIEIISRVHHRHLVSLVGCCICNDTRLLVYDYVPNKTLHHHLHEKGRPVMNWEIRMKIALGAARGIAYLHEDCHPQIIHRDIKSSNILLDSNFDARVSDFGLAKLSEEASTHVTTRLVGTFGYLAPEYVSSGKLSAKSDVFSFGVVILELLTGREPVDSSRSLGNESLVEWARPLLSHSLETGELGDLSDPKLQKSYNPSEARRMVEIAASCIRHSSSMRPHMGQVVRALDALDEPVDLTNGVRPGQSKFLGSSWPSAEIRLFQQMAFGSQDHSGSLDKVT